ncbi:MAG TPA: extracellular solute-binding protein [Paracoccaceae bacterium]|nr:extracellular solute-binding protein [Paracoccaceae bacterium]
MEQHTVATSPEPAAGMPPPAAAPRRARRLWRVLLAAAMVFGLAPALPVAAGDDAAAADGQEVIVSHGISSYEDLKYPPDFPHLDYVNPDAPKGGEFSTWAFGTFDSLNPYILRGTAASLASIFYDSLMTGTADEPDSMYGLVAETIEYPPDRSWAIFNMREEARFADGTPVTAEDVVFSFNVLLEKGQPSYRVFLEDIEKVEALDTHRVKFTFREGVETRGLPLTAAGLPIFSKAYWEGRDFAQSTLEAPLGSGPYRLVRADPGRVVIYERRDDYWAKDLPIMRGRNNYDRIRVEYFADYTAAFEAFKGGAYHFRTEFSSLEWATGYDFPALHKGWVVKESLPDGRPNGTQGFFFNLRRPVFEDIRVRQALGLMFNFEWANETLFYGLYERTDSFWENSHLQAEGLPEGAELALLEPLRDQLRPEVFTEPAFTPPESPASRALDRRALREAARLLDEAGWELQGNIRRNVEGQPLRVEILNDSPSFDRIINPYIENLRRLGVDAVYVRVDSAQATEREKSFDFDIITRRYVMSLTPGSELRSMFGSRAAEIPDALNIMGLADPAVDALIREVEAADTREELETAVRALDRVLRSLHVWIPQWYNPNHNIAYLDVYRRPEQGLPPYAMGEVDFWWYDAERAAELRAAGAF